MIKRMVLGLLAILICCVPLQIESGQLLQKRLVATVDLSTSNVPYTELIRYDTKAGRGDALLMRVEVTGAGGATNGFVLVPVPVWDRSATPDLLAPINFVLGNGGTAIDSVKVTTDIDDMYVFVWGDGTLPPLGGMLPPYISMPLLPMTKLTELRFFTGNSATDVSVLAPLLATLMPMAAPTRCV